MVQSSQKAKRTGCLPFVFCFFIIQLLDLCQSNSPSFLTTLSDCKTGQAVLTVSSPTTSSGYDSNTITITYASAFSTAPNMTLGLGYISSIFPTTTSTSLWVLDITISGTTTSSGTLVFNRTTSLITAIQVNYLAVLTSFSIQITTTKLDLVNSTLWTTASGARSVSRNLTYKTKSNSTNAIIYLTTIGLYASRTGTHTFEYTLTVSAKYSDTYAVTIAVPDANSLRIITLCSITYESVVLSVTAPLYMTIGSTTDFSGTITDSSGASTLADYGTIFSGMSQWKILDSNGVNNYNFTISGNTFTMSSTSLQSVTTTYFWYRQQICDTYYYLSSHTCTACDISCLTCSSSTATSCLSCPSTRTLYPNKTCLCNTSYADLGNRQCTLITCNTDLCRTCYYIDQCATCNTGLNRYLSSYQCVCLPYYFDQYNSTANPYCSACHYSCLTCSAASTQTACLTCNSTRDHRSYKTTNNTCTCVSGYFDNSTTICVSCQHSCATCTAYTFCTLCNATKYRVWDSTATLCACTTGYYDNGLVQQCQPCKYTCATCTNSTMCLTCPSTRNLTNTSTLNFQCTCITGYYDNQVSNDCIQCSYSCYSCIQAATCDSCSSTMHRTYNSTTKLCSCLSGYYDDMSSQLCATCYYTCSSCSGAGQTACTSCKASSYRTLLTNGTCTCSDGYYEISSVNTQQCASCYYACATCSVYGACLTCNALKNRIADSTNTSQCNCVSGYYDIGNQLCPKCPYYCLTCDDTATCLTCQSTTRLTAPSCSCKNGYYDDGASSLCVACLSSCLTCTNGYNCSSCLSPALTLTSTAQCVCSSGYLSPSCTACSYQCQQCSTTADNCVKCSGSYHRYYQYNTTTSKGSCLCYDTYYSDNATQLCKSCQYSCLTCTDSTKCLSCPTNRIFDSSSIYCVCKSQYYQNSTSLNCLSCHYSCANCSTYSVCTSCDSSTKYRYLASTLLCVCLDGYYDDGSSQLCYQCDSACLTCIAYSVCATCNATLKRVLSVSSKKCVCGAGYYQSNTDYLCKSCEYSCLTCLDGVSCLTCVSGRSYNIDTGLCVCSTGTFQNTSTLLCQACTYPCVTCSTSSSLCLSCQSSHTYLSSTKQCYCPIGTFQNTTKCQSCLTSCLTCTTSTTCDTCSSAYNRQLVLSVCPCIDGYHDQNNTYTTCIVCQYSCATCSNSTTCNTCASGRTLINGTSGLCACPTYRYYDDGANAVCKTCAYYCYSCQTSSTFCTACLASAHRQLYIDNTTSLIQTCTCASRYYSDGINQLCQSCQYSCATCTNSSVCLTCNATLHRIVSSTYCVCENGYYDVTNLQTCQTCDYTCLTCTLTSSYCLSCPSTRTFSSNTCPCSIKYYNNLNTTCASCLYLCSTCQDGTSCLTCPSTRTLNTSSLCQCKSGYYDDMASQQCLQCHPTCKLCTDYSVCTACDQSTLYRYLSSSSCVCLQGYYDVVSYNGSYICAKCDHSCLRCIAGAICSACDALSYRIRNVNTGLCDCLDGYYDDNINEYCLACAYDCLTCTNSSQCLSCPSGRTLSNTTSRCICPSAYYTNGSQCLSCPPQCLSCTSTSICTSCNNPTYRTLTTSSQCTCIQKYYPVTNSPSCLPCLYVCATCTSQTSCSSCNSTMHRYMSNKLCKCMDGYYDDSINQQCATCHYSCLTCVSLMQCSTCDSSANVMRVYDTTTLYCVCEIGYYQDPSTKRCTQCHYSCLSCTNSTACLTCSSTSLRVYNVSTHGCECADIGYFDSNGINVCAACTPTCYTCTGTSAYCLDCNTNTTYRVLTSSHTCICNGTYFQSTSTTYTVICSTCSYQCLTCTSALTVCTSCDPTTNRNTSSLPTCSCLIGYFDNGVSTCAQCDYRCYKCASAYTCTECDTNNTYRSLNIGSQLCLCLQGYYPPTNAATTRNNICLKCSYTCLTCAHGSTCLTCNLTGLTRYYSNGLCVCSTGYYDNGINNYCLKCSYKCLTCSASSSTCTSCLSTSHRKYNSTELSCSCLIGYYDTGVSVCGKCESSCYTCTNGTACATCLASTNKYINLTQSNYCICYYGYYSLTTTITSTTICNKCHYSCQKCTNTSATCTACQSTKYRTLSSSGSCVCLNNYYDDGTNQLCIRCASTQCSKCYGSLQGQCLQCNIGSYLLNGLCLSACPDYYYQVSTSEWKCSACLDYCQVCTNGSSCETCQYTYYLMYNQSSTNYYCVNNCGTFWYHTQTTCLQCISPCLQCTSLYVCLSCIQTYYLQPMTSTCLPCYSTCRYCHNSTVTGCITCVDGYYLNTTTNVCNKLNCGSGYYVNSMYGCYLCNVTYPNSRDCTVDGIATCSTGYLLYYVGVSDSTGLKVYSCRRCDQIQGYKLVDNQCEQVCGDGLRTTAPCDDGNTLNGDGCSSICTIQRGWECDTTISVSLPSECVLAASTKPTISVVSVNKIYKNNQVYIVIKLNVGLRLEKGNFVLKFGNGQGFDYWVGVLNAGYTSYGILIQYYQSIAREMLTINVVSPITSTSSEYQQQQQYGYRQNQSENGQSLQQTHFHNRLLTSSSLSISLSLSLSLQISTLPPALYYSQPSRYTYTTIIYSILIILHILILLFCLYCLVYLKLKVMLFTIQLLNAITLLYIYGAYGLSSVSELTVQSTRGLQHFVYKFGENVPDRYLNTSVYNLGFGAFIISGCILQIVIILAVSIYKNAISQKNHKYSLLNYYQVCLIFGFMPDLLLCCVVVFKWVDMHASIQSSYSWGIAILLVVMIGWNIGGYFKWARPYVKVQERLRERERQVQIDAERNREKEEKEFGIYNQKEKQKELLEEEKYSKNQQFNNTLQTKGNLYTPSDTQSRRSINNFNDDPFAQQQLRSSHKSQKSLRSTKKSKNIAQINQAEQNKTQAMIFNSQKQSIRSSSARQSLKSQRQAEQSDKSSHRSNKTTQSQLKQQIQLTPLFDISPVSIPKTSNLTFSQSFCNQRIILHQSYLPVYCGMLPLFICIFAQIQQPLPRCCLLFISQICTILYLTSTFKKRSLRYLKQLLLSIVLMFIAIAGIVGSVLTGYSTLWQWGKISSSNGLYILQAIQISLVLLGLVWAFSIYSVQIFTGIQYKQYRVQVKNQQILEQNMRRNRLKNINLDQNANITRARGFGSNIKNIFSGIKGDSYMDNDNNDDRNETKQNFGFDSQINTPGQTSNHIFQSKIRRDNNVVDIQDIEDEDIDAKNIQKPTNMQKKLNNAILNTIGRGSEPSLPANQPRKSRNMSYLEKQKEFKMNQIEASADLSREADRTGHLQSTRVQKNKESDKDKYKNANKITQILRKQDSRMDKDRRNNFMSRLESELMGNDENTIIAHYHIDKRKKYQQSNENTLISEKEYSLIKEKNKKKVEEQKIGKKNSGIVKNLIPTHQNEENHKNQSTLSKRKPKSKLSGNESASRSKSRSRSKSKSPTGSQDRVQRRSVSPKLESKQSKLSNFSDKKQQEHSQYQPHIQKNEKEIKKLDGFELYEKQNKQQIQENQINRKRNYQYNITSDKNAQKQKTSAPKSKQKSKPKSKVKSTLDKKQSMNTKANKQEQRIKRAATNPYQMAKFQTQMKQEQNSDQDNRIPIQQQQNEFISRPYMQSKIQILPLQSQIKEDPTNNRKGRSKLRRIDSISSIQDLNTQSRKDVFEEDEQEQAESEGITVFKKLLNDYQVYKNKKVKKNASKHF